MYKYLFCVIIIQMDQLNYGNCGGCPVVGQCSKIIADLLTENQHLASTGMDPNVEKGWRDLHKELLERTDLLHKLAGLVGERILSEDELVTDIRRSHASIMDGNDSGADMLRTLIGSASENCNGPLIMRAKRSGSEVRATICMSPTAPADSIGEPVRVVRTND